MKDSTEKLRARMIKMVDELDIRYKGNGLRDIINMVSDYDELLDYLPIVFGYGNIISKLKESNKNIFKNSKIEDKRVFNYIDKSIYEIYYIFEYDYKNTIDHIVLAYNMYKSLGAPIKDNSDTKNTPHDLKNTVISKMVDSSDLMNMIKNSIDLNLIDGDGLIGMITDGLSIGESISYNDIKKFMEDEGLDEPWI